MSLQVGLETFKVFETLSALNAQKQGRSAVALLVRLEIVRVLEALLTLAAVIRPLPSVSALVSFQLTQLLEPLPALLTAAQHLLRVDPDVRFEAVGVPETLPAVAAVKRGVAVVNPLVFAQRPGLPEILPAFQAVIRLLSRMNPLVGLKGGGLPEALPAVGAPVRGLARVNEFMLLEVPQLGEGLPAHRAVVRRLAGGALSLWLVFLCRAEVQCPRVFLVPLQNVLLQVLHPSEGDCTLRTGIGRSFFFGRYDPDKSQLAPVPCNLVEFKVQLLFFNAERFRLTGLFFILNRCQLRKRHRLHLQTRLCLIQCLNLVCVFFRTPSACFNLKENTEM